jgi:hypothetical protein
MATIDERRGDGDATEIWWTVWRALESFVAEARRLLGAHLRHDGVSLRALDDGAGSLRGRLSIGSTRLVLECPRRCAPASPLEAPAASALGIARPLARVAVRRDVAPSIGPIESMLFADPRSRLWISTDPELGPAPLADAAALDAFFWSLLVDRATKRT